MRQFASFPQQEPSFSKSRSVLKRVPRPKVQQVVRRRQDPKLTCELKTCPSSSSRVPNLKASRDDLRGRRCRQWLRQPFFEGLEEPSGAVVVSSDVAIRGGKPRHTSVAEPGTVLAAAALLPRCCFCCFCSRCCRSDFAFSTINAAWSCSELLSVSGC